MSVVFGTTGVCWVSDRFINAGHIVSGSVKTKRMQALAHWVQDFKRVRKEVTIDGLAEATFLQALNISAERAAAREADKDNSDARAKEASPGKLTLEKEWEKWETRLIKKLSILYKLSCIPECKSQQLLEWPGKGDGCHYCTW